MITQIVLLGIKNESGDETDTFRKKGDETDTFRDETDTFAICRLARSRHIGKNILHNIFIYCKNTVYS